MRIGVDARTLQVARYGVARYLTNILTHCLELDERNEYILYLSEAMPPADFPIPEGSRLSYSVLQARPSILWRHVALPLQMRKDQCDLHFSPSYFVPMLKVCPHVVVVHDISFKAHPEWFAKDKRMFFDGIFWRKVAKAEAIITVSEYSKAEIVKHLGVDADRIRVILEDAESGFIPLRDQARLSAVKEKYGLPQDFVLTVGALHTRRNVPRLFEALARLEKETGSPVDVVVVGSQAPFSPVVNIAELAGQYGLRGRVLHLDYISEEDLVLLYNACTMLAYPSLYEGFGLPVLEALACGTPVACSNVTSIPEVAGDAALYFDPYDTDDMAKVLGQVWSEPARREELSRAGIDRASAFSWREASRELLEVFDQVLA